MAVSSILFSSICLATINRDLYFPKFSLIFLENYQQLGGKYIKKTFGVHICKYTPCWVYDPIFDRKNTYKGDNLAQQIQYLRATLVQNEISELVNQCNERVLRNMIFAHPWTFQMPRTSRKLKKAKKIFEGQNKGQNLKFSKFGNFFSLLGSFGVLLLGNPIV